MVRQAMEAHLIEAQAVREVIRWDGAYDQSWKDLIVPAAFAHP